jgi:hypothetical protein
MSGSLFVSFRRIAASLSAPTSAATVLAAPTIN